MNPLVRITLLILLNCPAAFLVGQVTMSFENLTTGQNCGTSVSCNYRDMGNPLVPHDLADDVDRNIPVNSPETPSSLGFKSSFRPSRTQGAMEGLTEGDFFGYAGSTTFSAIFSQNPTDGDQAFVAEDTDGEVTVTFSKVRPGVGSTFTMDYIVDASTFENSDGADDLFRILLEVTDCGGATIIDLFHGTGTGGGGTVNLNSLPDDTWMSINQDLSAYTDCLVELRILIDLDSNSEEVGFDNIQFSSGIILPVEFTHFSAEQYKEDVILNWATSVETENHGFSVERSTDGNTFSIIGWQDGAGEASEMNRYEFTDASVVSGQTYYYRLRQEDFDGTFAYSSLAAVTVQGNREDNSVAWIYPSPTNGQSSVHIKATTDGEWTLKIMDFTGKIVRQKSSLLTAGDNAIPIDLSNQSAGVYLVYLSDSKGNKLVKRVTKL